MRVREGDVSKAMIEVMSRRGHRNGYTPRSLKTRMGELSLPVPRVRVMEPNSRMLFAEFERSERVLLAAG